MTPTPSRRRGVCALALVLLTTAGGSTGTTSYARSHGLPLRSARYSTTACAEERRAASTVAIHLWTGASSRPSHRGRDLVGLRHVLRVKCALRISRPARGVLAGAAVGAALGLQLGLPTLAATNVAIGVVAGAALLRESVGLGRMLYDALQGVARRARLHYAPSTRARPR